MVSKQWQASNLLKITNGEKLHDGNRIVWWTPGASIMFPESETWMHLGVYVRLSLFYSTQKYPRFGLFHILYRLKP